MAQAERHHDLRRTYLTVWFWLFVLSFGLYFIDLMHLSVALASILYTAIALMKAGLIAAYFMHLRFERLNLIYTILFPLILLIALVAGTLPDGWSVFLLRQGF